MTNYVEHYEKRDYIYPLNRQTIHFQLKTNIEQIKQIEFVYFEKIRKIPETSVLMESFNVNGTSPIYKGTLSYKETIKYIDYYFKITTNDLIWYYSPEGLRQTKPRRSFRYSDTNERDVFETPSWAEGIIGYEIFPDRFHIGGEVILENYTDWDELPTRETFFGGNIQGIIEKIDYLKSMNIGIIYLTPIFKAYSNHKYDTIDYFEIDPGFGTKDDFKLLVKKLHQANIKIVIDGVFNHIGYSSKQFKDAVAFGKDSEYFNWFYINGDTIDTEQINYECVGYHKWMPKLRYQTKEVREYIKLVGRYWLDMFDIDGFRLDVADEVDFTFWNEFRATVKTINPEAILIGETWKNGSDMLGADGFDSIMNYRLRDALLELFVYESINLDEFKRQVESIYFDYPKQTHNILYNLLGSHDTERIITVCKDDSLKTSLLVSILFAMPGIPFIYYGDEIGTTGKNDPLSRKTMNWNNLHNQMHLFYLKETDLRAQLDVLKYGDFKHIDIAEDIYSFIRSYQDKTIVFLANTTNETKEFKLSFQGLKRDITLLPYKSEIIHILKK